MRRRRYDSAMPRPFLIIDGYNLMHAAGMAGRRYGPGQFEKSRNRFLRYLASHLAESERRRTTIVFDAQSATPGGSRGAHFEEMEIVFASGRDADDLIEEIIAAHSAPRQILLVSSDHRLQKAARRRRAKSVDSEELIAEFDRHGPVAGEAARPTPAADPKFSGQTPPAEIEMWLQEFGDVPQAKRRRGDRPAEPQRRDDRPVEKRTDFTVSEFLDIDVDKLREELE